MAALALQLDADKRGQSSRHDRKEQKRFRAETQRQGVPVSAAARASELPREGLQVTILHGLHLVDTPRALDEAHRLLKPRGKLVVAWNDR